MKKKKRLFSTPRFHVVVARYQGKDFYYLDKNDGVAAICTDRRGRILLLSVERVNTVGAMFELPGGRVESGESPINAVCREVAEEARLKVDIQPVEPLVSIMPLPSISVETIHVFVCRQTGCNHLKAQDKGHHEGIVQARFYRRHEIEAFLLHGRVSSAVDAYALLFYFTFWKAGRGLSS